VEKAAPVEISALAPAVAQPAPPPPAPVESPKAEAAPVPAETHPALAAAPAPPHAAAPAAAPVPPPSAAHAAPAPAPKSAPSTPPATPASRPAPPRGDALCGAPAAQLDRERAQQQAGGGQAYRSRTLSEAPSQFTGEPISLDLKDADIKDVFRTISQLTGL